MMATKQVKTYKESYNLEQRKEKARLNMQKQPEKVVLIVQPHKKSKLPPMNNPKMLCCKNYTFAFVRGMLHKKICEKIGKDINKAQGKQSLFLYMGKSMPGPQQLMSTLYEKFKDEDGFLYITYQQTQTF